MKNNKSALLIIDDVERMSDKVSFEEFWDLLEMI